MLYTWNKHNIVNQLYLNNNFQKPLPPLCKVWGSWDFDVLPEYLQVSWKSASFEWNLRKKSLSGWSRASVQMITLVGHLRLSKNNDKWNFDGGSGWSVKPILLGESQKKHPGFGNNALSSLSKEQFRMTHFLSYFWTLLDFKLFNMVLHKVSFVLFYLAKSSGQLGCWLNISEHRVSSR